MKNFTTELSQKKAVTYLRVLYPLWAIIGIFSILYVPAQLIVPGDAATTAKNIVDNELLFRLSIIGSLVTQLILIAVALIMYKLFKPVNQGCALLLVILGLIGVPIAMLNTLNLVAALELARGASFLTALHPDQLHSLMMFFLNLNDHGIIIASFFWGLWLFPYGYLVYKSGYFPKILGTLVIIAGFGYLLGSFAHFLLPENKGLLALLDNITIGETLFMAWVLFMGAKLPKQQE